MLVSIDSSISVKNPAQFLYISTTIPIWPPCSNVLTVLANAPAVTATIAAHDPWPTKADPAAAMPVSNGPEMAKILLTFNAKLPSLINIPVAAENKRVEDIFKAKRGAPTVPADATPAIVAAGENSEVDDENGGRQWKGIYSNEHSRKEKVIGLN
ncbi:hypothetical protein NC652_010157 [Populus alba x Populus x berolinensis]|nr:hypothetical protein NC652_010157 [Populus alba x Populus x berolinensis]